MADMNVNGPGAVNAPAPQGPSAEEQAAEAARRAAEEARRQAEEARRQAEEAQRRAEAAAAEAAKAKAAVEAARQQQDPNLADVQRKATDAQDRSDWASVGSLSKMNAAIEAEQTANRAAEAAKQPRPFEEADGVKDVFGTAGFDRERQKKVLGTDAFQTPQLRAQEDGKRVSAAASAGPVQGAQMTRELLEQNPDPDYRAALVDASKADLQRVNAAALDPKTRAEDKTAALQQLEQASALLDPASRPQLCDLEALKQNVTEAWDARVKTAQQQLHDAASGPDPVKAAQQLESSLNSVPQQLRGKVLEGAKDDLAHLTQNLASLDRGQTIEAVKYLGRAANAAGVENAKAITDPIAKEIAAGRLEQPAETLPGPDFVPGKATVERRNVHHSERELIDGVAAASGTPEGKLFQNQLAVSLNEQGAGGFAAAVAAGDSHAVPDDNLLANATNLHEDLRRKVADAGLWVAEQQRNAVRAVDDKLLGIDDNIASLNSEGDKWTAQGSAAGGAYAIQGAAEGELSVTKTKDGYKIEGQAAAGPGIYALAGEGAQSAGIELNALGGVKVELNCATKEEAQRAAKILASAPQTPPSSEDIEFLKGHTDKTTLLLKGQEKGNAILGEQLGLAGVGGTGEEKVEASVGIELEKGKAPRGVITVNGEVEVSATAGAFAELGKGRGLELPLSGGLTGKADLKAEVGFPIGPGTAIDLQKVANGDTDALRHLADEQLKTADVKLEGTLRASASAGDTGTGGEIKIEATTKLEQVKQFHQRLLSGDAGGAFGGLGDATQVDVKVRQVNVKGYAFSPQLGSEELKVAGQAKSQVLDYGEAPAYQYQGSATGFVREGQKVVDVLRAGFERKKQELASQAPEERRWQPTIPGTAIRLPIAIPIRG